MICATLTIELLRPVRRLWAAQEARQQLLGAVLRLPVLGTVILRENLPAHDQS